jgi:hypothetical protein
MKKADVKNENIIGKVVYKNIDDTMTGINAKNDVKKRKLIHESFIKHRSIDIVNSESVSTTNSAYQHVSVLLDNLLDNGFLDDYFKDIDEDERVNIINSQTRSNSATISTSRMTSTSKSAS